MMEKTSAEFPMMLEWRRMVLHQSDSKQFWNRKFYDYYKTKFDICLRCRPEKICEIGVRWGYSAFSFLCASPRAEFTGLDIIAGTHGGVRGIDTFGFVGQNLRRYFSQAGIKLIHINTQQIRSLDGPYDFVHVDGDHSINGAYHDICLAFDSIGPEGHVLIDDYDYIESVKLAAVRFLNDHGDECSSKLISSMRGELLISRKE